MCCPTDGVRHNGFAIAIVLFILLVIIIGPRFMGC